MSENEEFDQLAADAALIDEAIDSDKPIKWTEQAIVKPHAKAAIKRARQVSFLKFFTECGNLSQSCKAIGINIITERNWRKTDEWYREQFKDALQSYRDSVETEIHNRAIIGEKVPIIGKVQTPMGPEDRVIGHKVVKSDLLLMFHAKRHIPEYREKYEAPKDDLKPSTESPMARITVRLDMIGRRQQVSIPIAAEIPSMRQIEDGDPLQLPEGEIIEAESISDGE